jgi:hypothetical protein
MTPGKLRGGERLIGFVVCGVSTGRGFEVLVLNYQLLD